MITFPKILTEDSCGFKETDLSALSSSNGIITITETINSYDLIQAYPYDVDIYCVGMAASMAALLLAGGRNGHRFILPHGRVMIHEPLIADGFGGSATAIDKKAKNILQIKSTLNSILAHHTGQTVKNIDRATSFDNYMTAEEAVEFGICDEIRSIFMQEVSV